MKLIENIPNEADIGICYLASGGTEETEIKNGCVTSRQRQRTKEPGKI
jgi:hypothetical protein